MTSSQNRDVLERDDELLVIDENGESHVFDYDDDVRRGVTPVDASPEIIDWVEEQTDYFLPNTLDFPLTVTTTHHLEDTVGLELSRDMQLPLDEFLPQNRINYPSIQITEYWEIDRNANATLTHIEYDGTNYTPE